MADHEQVCEYEHETRFALNYTLFLERGVIHWPSGTNLKLEVFSSLFVWNEALEWLSWSWNLVQ
jgi:hypothetical protein